MAAESCIISKVLFLRGQISNPLGELDGNFDGMRLCPTLSPICLDFHSNICKCAALVSLPPTSHLPYGGQDITNSKSWISINPGRAHNEFTWRELKEVYNIYIWLPLAFITLVVSQHLHVYLKNRRIEKAEEIMWLWFRSMRRVSLKRLHTIIRLSHPLSKILEPLD